MSYFVFKFCLDVDLVQAIELFQADERYEAESDLESRLPCTSSSSAHVCFRYKSDQFCKLTIFRGIEFLDVTSFPSREQNVKETLF